MLTQPALLLNKRVYLNSIINGISLGLHSTFDSVCHWKAGNMPFKRYATLIVKNLSSHKRAVISWMQYKCEIGTLVILFCLTAHSIWMASLIFHMSPTVEKRKFLAFQWCITQVNLKRNDDFRPRSPIWDQSGIHLKRVWTLTVIQRYRDSRLRALS